MKKSNQWNYTLQHEKIEFLADFHSLNRILADGKIAIVGYCESTLKSKILKLKKRKYECYLHFDDQHVFCLIQFGMDSSIAKVHNLF